LLSFAAFAVVLYWICSSIRWDRVHSKTFRLLAFVGRHSLPVFAWSILLTYLATEFVPLHSDAAIGLLGVVLAVTSLVIPAQVSAMIRARHLSFPRSITSSLPTRLVGSATVVSRQRR
jgi:hypothetical protein